MIQDMKRLEEEILRNESIVQSFDTQEWKAVPSPPLYVFLRGGGGLCSPATTRKICFDLLLKFQYFTNPVQHLELIWKDQCGVFDSMVKIQT